MPRRELVREQKPALVDTLYGSTMLTVGCTGHLHHPHFVLRSLPAYASGVPIVELVLSWPIREQRRREPVD